MRRLAVLLVAFFWVVGASASELSRFASKYEPTVFYDVYRNGEPVGEYRLNFSRRSDSELQVDVAMDLSLRIMGLFSYDYRYNATEYWQRDELAKLEIEIAKNDSIEQIRADRQGERLLVKRGQGEETEVDSNLLTTHHWYPGILQSRRVLNTLSGKVSELSVAPEGSARWQIEGREVAVDAYRLGGDLKDTLSWYDGEGLWRGMRFLARDGSTIEVRWRGAVVPQSTGGALGSTG